MKQAYEFRGYKKGARSIYMRLLHLDPPVDMNIKKIRHLMRKYELFRPIRQANSYLFYRGGVCCLSPILDVCTHEALACRLSDNLRVDFMLDMLDDMRCKYGAELAAGCDTFGQVRAVVDDWMDYYNNDRCQWDLEKLSPGEYYRYRQTGVYPLKPVVFRDRNPRGLAHLFPGRQ